MRRTLFALALPAFALAAVISGCACNDSGVATAKPAVAPTAFVETADGKELKVTLEVADEEPERRFGLMRRQSLPENHGMLFIFPYEEIQSFWMKDTLIPLDMIFITSKHEIAGIVHEARPRTLTSRRVNKPSTYVLEVNGGWARKNKVRDGARVRIVGVPGHEQPREPRFPR